jgi:hypothetical protein
LRSGACRPAPICSRSRALHGERDLPARHVGHLALIVGFGLVMWRLAIVFP